MASPTPWSPPITPSTATEDARAVTSNASLALLWCTCGVSLACCLGAALPLATGAQAQLHAAGLPERQFHSDAFVCSAST